MLSCELVSWPGPCADSPLTPLPPIYLTLQETLARYPFSEVISTRKVKTEEGILFLDMKYGNLMQQKVVRIQSDNAHEISRLIRQYISIEQKHRPSKAGAEEVREGQASR